MFRLKELHLNNFMSFEAVSVDFSHRGFWIITGFNNRGGDSNGSGKSGILKGLVWTLFGKTQDGLAGKDVVRWDQNNCSGILKLQNNSQTYEIVRSLDSLEFFINGEKQTGHRKDLQTLINNTFGTDYNLFLTFNIFTKAWSNFITEIGDAGRKRLFKSILMLDQLDNALNKAKDIHANLNVQANKTEGMIKQLSNTLPELEDILNKNKESADNEERVKQEAIKELERQKIQLKPETVDFTLDATSIDKEIKDLIDLKASETAEYCNIKLTNIKNLIFHDKATLDDIEGKLKKMASIGGECPTCGQKILAKNKTMHMRHLEIIKNECVESLKDNEAEEEKINKEIYNADAVQQKIIFLNKQKTDIERQVWEQGIKLEKYNDFLKMATKSIENLKNSQTDYSKLIEVTQSKIDKIKIGLEYNQNMFNIYMKEIDYFSYLIWLYSRQGVINLIIEKCFARLKFLTNKYLRKICSEGFKLEISPQRALKSGDYKEEIDIFIWDGTRKVPYDSLSEGQKQRINVAMLIALFTWGREIGANSLDFIMLDEVLDLSLADKGQEDIINFIYELKPFISHIILISHKQNMTGRFDREVSIIRGENGISKLC